MEAVISIKAKTFEKVFIAPIPSNVGHMGFVLEAPMLDLVTGVFRRHEPVYIQTHVAQSPLQRTAEASRGWIVPFKSEKVETQMRAGWVRGQT